MDARVVSRSAVRAVARVWTILVLTLAGLATYSAAYAAANPAVLELKDPVVLAIGLECFELTGVILMHELGHYAAARFVGWKVRSIAIGPFEYSLSDRRISVRKMSAASLFSGAVAASPPRDRPFSLLNAAIVFAGGCAANFAFALVTFPFVGALRENWNDQTAWMAPLGSWSVISLIGAVANLVPFGGFNGIRSDGLRLMDLLVRNFQSPQTRQRKRTSAWR